MYNCFYVSIVSSSLNPMPYYDGVCVNNGVGTPVQLLEICCVSLDLNLHFDSGK